MDSFIAYGNAAGALGSVLGLFVILFLLALAILWFILPFAIFGVKGRLDTIIRQNTETNGHLRRIGDLLEMAEKRAQGHDEFPR